MARWTSGNRFAVLCGGIILLLVLVGLGAYAAGKKMATGHTPNASASVAVHEVTLELPKTEDEDHPTIVTAMGHYLVVSDTAGKVLYDGREVFSKQKDNEGNTICYSGQCAVLSQNGQHYAYTAKKTLYVDGKLVAKNVDGVLGVSDDGQSYMYQRSTSVNEPLLKTRVYRNDKLLYTAPGYVFDTALSADLTSTISSVCIKDYNHVQYLDCRQYGIFLDGERIYKSHVMGADNLSGLVDVAMSPDGKKYMHVQLFSGQPEVVVVGAPQTSNYTYNNPTAFQVTDAGVWSFSDDAGVYVGGRGSGDAVYSSTAYPIMGETHLYTNSDGSHTLLTYDLRNSQIDITNTLTWLLDGTKMTAPEGLQTVELAGDALYVYKTVNQ